MEAKMAIGVSSAMFIILSLSLSVIAIFNPTTTKSHFLSATRSSPDASDDAKGPLKGLFATAFIPHPNLFIYRQTPCLPISENTKNIVTTNFLPRPRLRHPFNDINKPKLSLTLKSTKSSSTKQDSGNDDVSNASNPPRVLCVGETLWDSLPSGMFLGGAPSNVAVHLSCLFQNSGASRDPTPTVGVATCLGRDQLGREAERRLALKGVRGDYIQYHEEWETGMSIAILNEHGDANYEFNTPAAWDGLRMTHQLWDLLRDNQTVFVMGTIASRLYDQDKVGADSTSSPSSGSTLMAIRDNAPEDSIVLDVNLRSPWYNQNRVLELARGSSVADNATNNEKSIYSPNKLALLKINEDELESLEQWCGLTSLYSPDSSSNKHTLFGSTLKERMEKLACNLNAKRVCVTRGKDGAALWCESQTNAFNKPNDGECTFFEQDGYHLPSPSGNCDTVGAGDAFLAALIHSLFICNESPHKALERACALGGYVAGCRGATPEHSDAPGELRQIFSMV